MIVTKDTLLTVNGCPTIVQHLADTGYEGLTRLQFVQKMQEDADAGLHPQWWVSWAKIYLYDGPAIAKLGEYVKTQRYDIYGMNIPEGLQIFNTIQDAILAVKQLQYEQMASEEWVFQVQAQCPVGVDAHTLHNCDLDGDGVLDHPVDSYNVFNHVTGLYESFQDFEEAKSRCSELRAERFQLICKSYGITEEVQQINDPEENPTGWIAVDVGTALDYSQKDYEASRP